MLSQRHRRWANIDWRLCLLGTEFAIELIIKYTVLYKVLNNKTVIHLMGKFIWKIYLPKYNTGAINMVFVCAKSL